MIHKLHQILFFGLSLEIRGKNLIYLRPADEIAQILHVVGGA